MKNLLIGLSALIGIATVGSIADSVDSPTQPASVVETTASKPLNTTPQVQKTKPTVTDEDIQESYRRSVPADDSGLSNDNYYTNVDGNKVHSPAYSDNGVPAGASAQCRDGTYSFSQNRRGTCSGHGGVASWL
ncbi:MAG: hypothetical protein RLZZ480_899 [Candidatus Parcubacteria bacterium]|jgi:hypothetical protein